MSASTEKNPTAVLKLPRFADAKASEDAWNALRENSKQRRSRMEVINANIEGVKPFDPDALAEAGLSNNANLNFRDMSAMVNDAVISYYELFHGAPSLADVSFKSEHPEAERLSSVFCAAYDEFIKERWGDEYYTNFFLFVQAFVSHGYGIAFMPSRNSPRWEAVLPENMEFPPLARSNTKKLDYFFVRQPFTLTDLYLSVSDVEAATAAGWKVGLTKKILARYYKSRMAGFRLQQSDIDSVWQILQNNAYGVECEKHSITIPLIHQFSKENDGKITHKIFLEGQQNVMGSKPDYLFDDSTLTDLPEDMSEMLAIVVANPGRGFLSTIKGYGDFAHDLTQAITVLRCEMIDRIRVADGLVFKNNDESKTPVLRKSSGITIIPSYLDAVTMQANTNNTSALVSQLENLKAVNNRRFVSNTNLVAQVDTAKQALMLEQGAAKIDLAQGSFFLVQFAQGIMKRQFERLRRRDSDDEDAIAFKKFCTSSMMETSVFHDAEIVVSTGSVPGASTVQTRIDSSLKLAQLSGLPSVNPRFPMEMFVRSAFGPNAVKRALLPDATQYGDDAQARQAMMENGTFNTNTPLPVDKRDRHDIHLQQHLPVLQQFAKAYIAGQFQVTRDAYIQFRITLEHAKEHFSFLQQDPTRSAAMQKMWPIFQECVGTLKKMESDANQMAEQQARAQNGQQMTHEQAINQLFPSMQPANTLAQRPADLAQASRQDNIAGGVTPDASSTV